MNISKAAQAHEVVRQQILEWLNEKQRTNEEIAETMANHTINMVTEAIEHCENEGTCLK